MNNKKSSTLNLKEFIVDFLPLLVFFVIFKLSNHPKPIIPATIALVITTLIILIINYTINKRIAVVPLFSALILGILGSLTIFSGNDIFIKMKPTFVNSVFAIILFVGYFTNKALLKYLFGGAIKLNHQAWMNLSLRWGGLFLFLAILNEIIWRNFSTEFWVQFKVFGILPISILFAIANTPYILKEIEKAEKN